MPDNISHTEYRLGNERLYRQAEYDAALAEAARLRREYDVATESYRISNDILAKALGGPETSPEYDMALKHHVWARRAAAAIGRLRANATEWVIMDGGDCVPIAEADPSRNPQPVTLRWIEHSRKQWAKACGIAQRQGDALRAEVARLTDAFMSHEHIQPDGELGASIGDVLADNERLRAEVARLTTWKEDADKALREEWRQRLLAFITGDGQVCIRCMEVTHDPDHWKSCPKHPARAEVERLQAELVTAKLQLADCIGDLSLSAELRRRLQANVRLQTQMIDGQRAEVERLTAENELYRHISVELQGENERLTAEAEKRGIGDGPETPQPKAGIYGKYIIQKMDGSPFDPQAVYFVLRLDTDPAARAAALAYSNQTTDTKLADDLRRLVGNALLRHSPADKEA